MRAVVTAVRAKDDATCDRAVRQFADGLAAVGVALLTMVVTRAARRQRALGVNDKGAQGATADRTSTTRSAPGSQAKPSGGTPAQERSLFTPKQIGETEPGAVRVTPELQAQMDAAQARGAMSAEGYPDLPADAARTFGGTPQPWSGSENGTISRIVGADNNPNGSFWSPQLPSSEASWRAGSAVQNDWNGNGAFVQSPSASLRGWIGPSAPSYRATG